MSIRRTQRERILERLELSKGARVPSPELAKISLQYGARILELRRLGYSIVNEIERVDGRVHGYFRLIEKPVMNAPDSSITPTGETERFVKGEQPLFDEGNTTTSTFIAHETGRGVCR